MTAQILHFRRAAPAATVKEILIIKSEAARPAPKTQPPPHWWWGVENITLATLAAAYAILIYGSHLKAIFQFISIIF